MSGASASVAALSRKLVVITGAAHGIGRVTALQFARLGARLELLDLDQEVLEKTASEAREMGALEVTARHVDVSRAEAVEEVANAIHGYAEAADVLVNNAGVGVVGEVLDTELEDWNWLLGVNLWGVIHSVRAFAPAMRRRARGGQIVNVVSAAGFFGAPGLGAYAATKHAVIGLSEALREELAPFGIGVTAVCPGVVSTAMAGRSRIRGYDEPGRERSRLLRISEASGTAPERVAAAIVRAVRTNPALVPVSAEARGLYLLKRFLPGLAPHVVRSVVRRRRARDSARERKGAGEPM